MIQVLSRIWDKMIFYMRYSVCGRVIFAVADFFRRAFAGSAIFCALASNKIESSWKESLFARLLTGFFGIFTSFSKKVGRNLAKGSLIFKIFGLAIEAVKNLTCRQAGAFGAAFGLTFALVSAVTSIYPKTGAIIGIAVFLPSVVFLLIPQKFWALCLNSAIIRLFINTEVSGDAPNDSRIKSIAFAAIGAAVAALSVISPMPTAIAVGGLIAAVTLLYIPEMGIFLCVGAAPFIPTMQLAAILGVTIVAFVLNLMFSDRYVFKLDITGVFIAAFAILLVFFAFTSYTPASSIKIALLECLFITSYFLIYTMINNAKKLKTLIFTFSTSALFAGLVGLYQYLAGTIDKTWVDQKLFEDLTLRVYSTFENPNVYAEYLLLCIPIAVAMIFISKRLLTKLYYFGIMGVLLLNLGLTYSRGCYLAIIIAAVIFIWFVAKRLIAVGFVGLFALPFLLPESIIKRFASITNLADSSTSYRLNIWQGTIRMLGDFWALGIGLGQDAFNSVYPRYSLNAIVAPHSHSLFLQVLSEMGIAGFIILCAFSFCFINAAVTAIKTAKPKMRIFIAAVLAGVLAFLFEGLFEYIWYNYRVFLIFFMTLAIGTVSCTLSKERGDNVFD